MKTILIKIEAGYNIVVGIDKPVINPIKTKIQNKELIDNIPEKLILFEIILALRLLKKELRLLQNIGNPTEEDLSNIEDLQNQIDNMRADVKSLKRTIRRTERNILKNNSVYFETKPNEIIVSNSEANEYESLLQSLIGTTNLLLYDKTIIPNNIGIKYILNGEIYTIQQLNEEGEGILVSSLTKEELEQEILNYKTQTEKNTMYNTERQLFLNKAAVYRSTLEIDNNPDPLGVSQNWFLNEDNRLKLKYNIS